MRTLRSVVVPTKVAALAAAVLIAGPLSGQEVERISGRSVSVYNLAGQVQIVRGSGPDVVVRITRGGSDASELRVETGVVRDRSSLRIIFPSDEIVYPELGRGSNTTVSVRGDGTFSDGDNGRGDRVRIQGRGSGLEAWADLVIEVPEGKDFALYVAVGEVEATGITGDLRIDTGSGGVTATGITGSLEIDTGSGSITARDINGDLGVDTGSGRVEVSGVTGRRIEIDTGSGGVSGSRLEADVLIVDTGSGSIELEAVTAA